MEELSDVFLAEQSLLGDKEAFSLLIERYQVMLFYIIKRYVADEEVARELVQEALLQAYFSLQQLRDGSRSKSWFYGITLHVCQSWLRRYKRLDVCQFALTSGSEVEEICLDPEEVILERELQQIVSEALLLLSPKNREVARLFYYEDLSI